MDADCGGSGLVMGLGLLWNVDGLWWWWLTVARRRKWWKERESGKIKIILFK